jgi:hypothetical protein
LHVHAQKSILSKGPPNLSKSQYILGIRSHIISILLVFIEKGRQAEAGPTLKYCRAGLAANGNPDFVYFM